MDSHRSARRHGERSSHRQLLRTHGVSRFAVRSSRGPRDPIVDCDFDRVFLVLRTLGDYGKVLEAWLRAGGHDKQADVIARSGAAASMWLELPDGLAYWAGRPVIG